MLARDIMDTRFHTLKPHETVAQAVKMFQTASREEGKKIFGLIVVDDADRLVGMLSMYDILLFIQPKHMKIWGEMEDLEPDRLFDAHPEYIGPNDQQAHPPPAGFRRRAHHRYGLHVERVLPHAHTVFRLKG
jgi:hypothetical protein